MHIHGHGQCDIRLAKADQERVLAEGKARPHRWAPATTLCYLLRHAMTKRIWHQQWCLFKCHTIHFAWRPTLMKKLITVCGSGADLGQHL